MRWVVALLLFANVAFYLWIGERAGDGERGLSAEPEVNREGMLLLHEIRQGNRLTAAAPATKPSPGKPAPDADSTAPAAANGTLRPAVVAPTPIIRADLLCYRIGPFKKEADWRAANRWMRSRQFDYQVVRSESREMRAVRVYLGPFDSRAAARPVMNKLEDRGIEHFINLGERGLVRVSLGYFTQDALAVKFIAHLLSQGVEASSRPEYRAMGPFDWMEASVATRRDLLLSHNWPGKGVAVLEIDCGEISPPAAEKAGA